MITKARAIILGITALVGVFVMLGITLGGRQTEQAARSFSELVGVDAPTFSLPDRAGRQVSLESLRGRKVVVFFSEGAMCYPSCWNQMAELAADPLLNNDRVTTLSIITDPKHEWEPAYAKMPELERATILFDTDRSVSEAYGVLTLPSSMHPGQLPGHSYLIVDESGTVTYVFDDPEMKVRNAELREKIGNQV